ncbi:MAG: AAA family ATPase [Bacteroidota bacterium]
MQRVLIIGSSGAGKSTLANQLALKWDLPLLHLDQGYWHAGWIESDKRIWREKVAQFVLAERWLMDGNYGGTMDLRVPRADLVIWLDYSRWLCIWRVIKRTLRYHGKTRPDMPDGCAERFDWSFLVYIYDFPRKHRARILKHLENSPDVAVLRFKSPRQLNQWQKQGYKLKN